MTFVTFAVISDEIARWFEASVNLRGMFWICEDR